MAQPVSTRQGVFDVHSEAHGPHWVAWLTRAGSDKPERSVVLVGETQEEAEARVRKWADVADVS